MNKIQWLSILLCASLLLSPLSATTAAVLQQQPAQRDPGILRQLITEDPANFYLNQSKSTYESSQSLQSSALPSMSRLAFQSARYNNWEIFLADPTGTNEFRLTNNSAADVDPSLARGAGLVAFASNRSGSYNIYSQNANGSNLKRLTPNNPNSTNPVISPDGSHIVFQSDRNGNSDLFIIKSDGSGLVQLTNTPGYDGEATWSPDGMHIAFISNRAGVHDLWVMGTDGSNPTQLTAGATAAFPVWSPSGTKIAFSNDSNMDGFYELWTMNPDGSGSSVKAQAGQGVNRDYWGASWSPDGKMIAMIATDWIYQQNQWWWTNSYLKIYDPTTGGFLGDTLTDNQVIRVSWSSTDITPPGPCSMDLKPTQTQESFLFGLSAGDTETGAAWFDVQVRALPDGIWQDYITTPAAGVIYQGVDGGQYEFRCRARDGGGNVQSWSTSIPSSTTVHASRPDSVTRVDQRYAKGPVKVNWAGLDAFGGINSYDIFVRDGQSGDWEDWLRGVQYTAAQYIRDAQSHLLLPQPGA